MNRKTSHASVLFISKRFKHHGALSGYEQLALRWPGRKKIENLDQKNTTSASKIRSWVQHKLYQQKRELVKRLAWGAAARERFEIIHVLYGDTDLPFPRPLSNTKLVATLHQPVSHLFRSKQRKDMLIKQLSNVDLCVTVSSDEANAIRSICHEKTPVAFIPHGVDTDFFSPKNVTRKRTLLLIDGWYRDALLARDVVIQLLRIDQKCKVRVVGLRQEALLIQHPRVDVLPRISDEQLRDEYASCAAVFLPLQEATANNALLESMSCGTPIVAPNLGGVIDYLGSAANLYDSKANFKEIACHIQQVLVTQEYQSKNKWRSLVKQYSWQNIIAKMNSLYHEHLLRL